MWTLDLTLLLTIGLLAFVGVRSHWTARLLILLLLSPVLRYGMVIFGFPIRLMLSCWTGALLRLAGFDVQAIGNSLICNGTEMVVDPACLGLQLTGASLLVAVGWVVWTERQARRRVPLGWLLGYGTLALGLTVASNLVRIMLLVLFHVAPANPLHEGIGLTCVAVYAWLPTLILARQLVQRCGRTNEFVSGQTTQLTGGLGGVFLSFGIGISWLTGRPASAPILAMAHPGYTCQTLANGYAQCSRPGVLVYEKPMPDWWSAEHSPTACWTGSGYTLRRIREAQIGHHPAYVAELHRDGQTLYTAWWFSDGHYQTTGQLDFRWRMAKTTGQASAPVFRLVNITAGSWGELAKQGQRWE